MYGFEEALITIFGILVLVFVVWAVSALVFHLIKGAGLARMARNAGLPNPALAWIPVANNYLLGCLCDRAVYCRTGKQWRFSIILPVLDLVSILGGGSITAALYGIFTSYYYYGSDFDITNEGFRSFGGNLFAIATTVAMAIALYHLFCDYDPGREVLYTVLSVIFGSVAQAILIFVLRDRVPLSAQAGGYPPPYQAPGQPGPWAPPPAGPAQWGQQPPGQGGPAAPQWGQQPSGQGGTASQWGQQPSGQGGTASQWGQQPSGQGGTAPQWGQQPPWQGGSNTTQWAPPQGGGWTAPPGGPPAGSGGPYAPQPGQPPQWWSQGGDQGQPPPPGAPADQPPAQQPPSGSPADQPPAPPAEDPREDRYNGPELP